MQVVGFTAALAGLDGRTLILGFTGVVATVWVIGEPGTPDMGFSDGLAGLDGRNKFSGFT
jgi:hypothetical protein